MQIRFEKSKKIKKCFRLAFEPRSRRANKIFFKKKFLLRCQAERTINVIGAIENPRTLMNPQVNQQRSSIFGQKYSFPSDLRAQIFHIEFAAISQTKRFNGIAVLKGLASDFQTQCLPIRIQFTIIRINFLLQFLDGCGTLDIGLQYSFRVFSVQYFNL